MLNADNYKRNGARLCRRILVYYASCQSERAAETSHTHIYGHARSEPNSNKLISIICHVHVVSARERARAPPFFRCHPRVGAWLGIPIHDMEERGRTWLGTNNNTPAESNDTNRQCACGAERFLCLCKVCLSVVFLYSGTAVIARCLFDLFAVVIEWNDTIVTLFMSAT